MLADKSWVERLEGLTIEEMEELLLSTIIALHALRGVGTFPLSNGEEVELDPKIVASWYESFSPMRVGDQLLKARAHAWSAPPKQRPKKWVHKYCHTWLKKAHAAYKRQPASAQVASMIEVVGDD